MAEQKFIPTKTLCLHYDIEIFFIDSLNNMGLIKVQMIEQRPCIHQDQLADLEKMIRLHNELKVNLEGIDVVINLLKKERALRNELMALKNRLRRLESD